MEFIVQRGYNLTERRVSVCLFIPFDECVKEKLTSKSPLTNSNFLDTLTRLLNEMDKELEWDKLKKNSHYKQFKEALTEFNMTAFKE